MRKILGIAVASTAVLVLAGTGAAYATTGPSHGHGGCDNGNVSVGQDNDLIDADVLNGSLNCNHILNNFLNDNKVLGILSN